MAIPTDVRVESNSSVAATIRWTDTIAVHDVDVQRSEDNITYVSIATVAHGEGSYVDESLVGNTKYWYQLSQTTIATFTTPVSVWSQQCESTSGATASLPRASGPEDVVAVVNDLAQTVESKTTRSFWSGTPSEDITQQCDACVIDGRLILDCSLNCEAFSVVVTEDINSISVINCPNCPPVDFLIPPNSDVGICGWPAGCFYSGDECHDSRETTDNAGGTTFTDGTGRGRFACRKGKPDPSCLCPVDVDDILRVVCCTTTNTTYPDCNLNCDEPIVTLLACGGCGPYQWEIVSGPGSVRPKKGRKVVVKKTDVDTGTTGAGVVTLGVRFVSTNQHSSGLPGCPNRLDTVILQRNPLTCGGADGGFYDHPDIRIKLTYDDGNAFCGDCCGACSPVPSATLDPHVGTSWAFDVFTNPIGACGPGDETFSDTYVASLGTTDVISGVTIAVADCTGDCSDTEDIVVRVTDKVGTSVTVIM